MNKIQEEFPFLYETHMHTTEGSACAHNSGREMARAYKEAGYAGIIITDHNWGGNTRVNRYLPWKDWVETFAKGYESAKAEGDKIGLDVYFGWEAGYQGTEFLIYGLDKNWMIAHPEIKTASVEQQYKLVSESGGMVIHAHPYREEDYIPEIRLFPEFVDGVEGINATHSNTKSMSHNNPEYDKKAIEYARNLAKPITAGSDMHNTNLFQAGVAFKTRLTGIQDYIKRIKSEKDYVVTNGESWYDPQGNLLK